MTELDDTQELRTESGTKRGGWYLLLGLVLGVILGLAYTWVVNPVIYETTAPSMLSDAHKETYRTMIAQVYAATGNLERASLRLEVLEDDDPVYALGSQAQRVLAEGSVDEAQALALLASAIQQSQTAQGTADATQTIQSVPTQTLPAPTATP